MLVNGPLQASHCENFTYFKETKLQRRAQNSDWNGAQTA